MDYLDDVTTWERQLVEKATLQHIPIYGIFELTPLCNLNCRMCFVRLTPEEMQRQGRLRTYDEWMSLAEQMKTAGTLFVLLTGGEPLLHPDFEKIYLALQEMGMILTINTNGTLIDEKWAEFFAANKPRRINITLYGSDRDTYQNLCGNADAFDKTVNAIRMLTKRGVSVKVNGSLTPANCHQKEAIASIAQSLGAACKVDTYMYPGVRERSRPFDQQSRLTPQEAAKHRVELMELTMAPEEFEQTAMQMLYIATHTPPGEAVPGSVRCRAGRSSFTINWQGEMRPCVMMSNLGVPVFELGFEKSWAQVTDQICHVTLSSKCSACTLRGVCNTCAACAILEQGSFDAVPEYMCRYTVETLNCLAARLRQKHADQKEETTNE